MSKMVYLATTMTCGDTYICLKKNVKVSGLERAGAGIWAEAEEGTGVRAGIGVPAPCPGFSLGASSCPASCPGSYFSFYPCSCPSSCSGPRLLPRNRLLPGSIPAPLQSVLKLSPAQSSPTPAQSSSVLAQPWALLKPSYAPVMLQPSPSPANPCPAPAQPSLALALLQTRPSPHLTLIQSSLPQPCSRLFQHCFSPSQSKSHVRPS